MGVTFISRDFLCFFTYLKGKRFFQVLDNFLGMVFNSPEQDLNGIEKMVGKFEIE